MLTSGIVAWLEAETGFRLRPGTARRVAGGCIHEACLVDREDGGTVFLKSNCTDALPLLTAERRCLDLIAASGTIRVPQPYAAGIVDGKACLAMEGLELVSGAGESASACMAERLAALHGVCSPDGRFGADFDNFIGATPQSNTPADSWADFFVGQRLEPQLEFAAARGRVFPEAARLLSAVHTHLASLKIESSLLHGDLWGGNAAFLPDGEPVLFDPASYYGDRETDLAFTRLFGGFAPAFYRRYRELIPAPEPVRESIYNLYHLLNHDHLFGGAYAEQSATLMREILREIG
jgi:fructosamine-3-kinase